MLVVDVSPAASSPPLETSRLRDTNPVIGRPKFLCERFSLTVVVTLNGWYTSVEPSFVGVVLSALDDANERLVGSTMNRPTKLCCFARIETGARLLGA